MSCIHHLHRVASACAPLVLLGAAALPQSGESAAAPAVTAPPAVSAVQTVAAVPAAPEPCVRHTEWIGRPVQSTTARDEAGAPAPIGTLVDLIIDVHNGTLPHVVVDVADGPRTTFPWRQGAWDAERRCYRVDVTPAEARSRAEIDPDLVAGVGSEPEGGPDAAAASARPLPRQLLASRLTACDAWAQDGRFGAVGDLFVVPARGEVRFLTVEPRPPQAGEEATAHVVPFQLATLRRGAKGRIQVRLDRPLATLRTAPMLTEGDDSPMQDQEFRDSIFAALGIERR